MSCPHLTRNPRILPDWWRPFNQGRKSPTSSRVLKPFHIPSVSPAFQQSLTYRIIKGTASRQPNSPRARTALSTNHDSSCPFFNTVMSGPVAFLSPTLPRASAASPLIFNGLPLFFRTPSLCLTIELRELQKGRGHVCHYIGATGRFGACGGIVVNDV